ncbi:MAG: acyl-CoA/acyl-ACP dehydrogenase [Alphaproteobacteria bacterium]|nr:acyl-CoA/acyl-ACP dehydrogenase [Alphaproteobacteria bacterium]
MATRAALLATAQRLGRENFLPRAAGYDREGRFPTENYADLRAVGFLGLVIPERYGGLGVSYADYMEISAELGRWCGATALTFNMHCATMLWSSRMADDLEMTPEQRAAHEQRRKGIYRKVIEDGAIFAQPFSEPNSAAAAGKAPFGTTARKVEAGWLVNGYKHFASLAGSADYYGVLCTEARETGEADVRDTIYLAVDGRAEGLKISGDWDVLGMRATVSNNLELRDVFVPDTHQLMPRGKYYQAALNWPHMFMSLCPTYMGIAQAAFDFTCQYLRGEIEGGPPAGSARHSPAKQMAVAEMRIKLEQARAMFLRAIGEAGVKPAKDARLRAYVAQYTVMEYANDICRLALRTCGGRAIFRTLRLEQLYRDSRCGSLMLPWTPEICMERLGRESLFEAGES